MRGREGGMEEGRGGRSTYCKALFDQGSVLGPILFVLYTRPISEIVSYHSLSHHSFSDDNQLYKFQLATLLNFLKSFIQLGLVCLI